VAVSAECYGNLNGNNDDDIGYMYM
jgi:hypothetical protein